MAVVTAAMVLQEIVRRVPVVPVGVAPGDGQSLVNAQTVLWAGTAVQVPLGTVRLVGQAVGLRVQVRQVVWDFGDGSGLVSADPGRPYEAADGCVTALCAGFFGHVYRRHGDYRVTVQVSWFGQYRVGGGPWQQIPTAIAGRLAQSTVHVHQAHGVLVPDPTDHNTAR